jgi:hypothetical protein
MVLVQNLAFRVETTSLSLALFSIYWLSGFRFSRHEAVAKISDGPVND